MSRLLYLFLSLICLSSSAFSSPIDYNIGGIYKNRTLVLGLDGKLSHKTSFWGDRNLLLKGYSEESLYAFTAGISNIVEPSIEFFPLAILGIGGGAYWNQSFTNSMEIKACKNSVECKGLVQWYYGKATLQAKYENAMFRAVFKKGRILKKGAEKPFYESATVLIVPAEGSYLETWEFTGAYTVHSQWTGGIYYARNVLSAEGSSSRLGIAFANYTPSSWSYLLGLGYFSSPVLNATQSDYKSEMGFLIVLSANYKGTFTPF